ncbi:uncharacterized protein ACRADG_004650 [Cochliomyia hominivorax]
MSKNTFQMSIPSAPTVPQEFERGPPPPSYEECLKMNGAVGTANQHQYIYSNPTPYQQQQAFVPPPPVNQSYGYSNPYQTHIQQQQSFYNMSLPQITSTSNSSAVNTLYLAKGAKVRTTATGAISIPPPPPGCVPTPAQMAAMSGQQVVVKKQKKSFF